jgi:hypothetical protein
MPEMLCPRHPTLFSKCTCPCPCPPNAPPPPAPPAAATPPAAASPITTRSSHTRSISEKTTTKIAAFEASAMLATRKTHSLTHSLQGSLPFATGTGLVTLGTLHRCYGFGCTGYDLRGIGSGNAGNDSSCGTIPSYVGGMRQLWYVGCAGQAVGRCVRSCRMGLQTDEKKESDT